MSLAPHPDAFLRFGRSLYYWVGARELLPAAWRWYTACVQHGHASGDETLIHLGGSVLTRVQRALEVRDTIHRALNQPQNNTTGAVALSNLDVALVFLLGAVDATARVADVALSLSSRPHRIGWQKNRRGDWLDRVANAPGGSNLAQLFASNADHRYTLTILRLLRNTIHGEALHSTTVQRSPRTETPFCIPPADEVELRDAFKALGGEAKWGVEELHQASFYADPGALLEELFTGVLAMLNDVMKLTPVEQLSHVKLTPVHHLPPSGSDDKTFSATNRQVIRLQLGL